MPDVLDIEAPAAAIATVNGVALHEPGERLSPDALRQRACTELLRQEATRRGLTGTTEHAIESLLEQALVVPEPTEAACRRIFDANPARFARGERLRLRHVLVAVTEGIDVNALRKRAEALLLELRCADPDSDVFRTLAKRWSNCPTGADGGDLGWVTRDDCVSEFAREVFGQQTVGILPRLVHSRFGFHIVEVSQRETGVQAGFEEVERSIAATLRQQAWANALRQYLQLLAGQSRIDGVDLQAADSPLVQ
ncbi:peptidylprolyl isomerase [Aquincola sp. S2]|uniref:peptidylprolyl isomerase n=1 Tax=Pseudaquabacterium terrae TaxID=2732868 RepID=A0ABX2ERD7_9BURK|nr:peptidylprolyl isomerase [Aquabacterium terrae]NRF71019.1 peptidylprolyl isomerase [Aquabacterium terrae]